MQPPPETPPTPHDPKAWREGFDAGHRGVHLAACRYPPRSDEALAWASGFIEGKAARLRLDPRI